MTSVSRVQENGESLVWVVLRRYPWGGYPVLESIPLRVPNSWRRDQISRRAALQRALVN